MTNKEKAELTRLVKESIGDGRTMNETVKRVERHGFTNSTIRKYYRVWKVKDE